MNYKKFYVDENQQIELMTRIEKLWNLTAGDSAERRDKGGYILLNFNLSKSKYYRLLSGEQRMSKEDYIHLRSACNSLEEISARYINALEKAAEINTMDNEKNDSAVNPASLTEECPVPAQENPVIFNEEKGVCKSMPAFKSSQICPGIFEERAFVKRYTKDLDELYDEASLRPDLYENAIESLGYYHGESIEGEVRCIVSNFSDFRPDFEPHYTDGKGYMTHDAKFLVNIAGHGTSSEVGWGIYLYEKDGILYGQGGNSFESEIEWAMDLIGEGNDDWLDLIETYYVESPIID